MTWWFSLSKGEAFVVQRFRQDGKLQRRFTSINVVRERFYSNIRLLR
jgi:hypothetical protein